MLAARGVSLGLGKINLSDLNQLPADRVLAAQLKKAENKKKPRVLIKKKADAKTVWAACRAVIFGCIIIAVGLAMAVLGYFDKHFAERVEIVNGTEKMYHDKLIQYQLKSMQYLGPILMGIGCFILIVACVVTLESRDKHAQIITEESIMSKKRKRLLSTAENNELLRLPDDDPESFLSSPRRLDGRSNLDALAPLADEDSIDLSSTSSHRPDDDSHSRSVAEERTPEMQPSEGGLDVSGRASPQLPPTTTVEVVVERPPRNSEAID
ncbi:unnamed protein product [Caenorhabditis auriculariae]|uniref:Uncharacterized protein n=1 Tax=Caenorhabditis auriculariae TaxID=2777116 RepID=A0A8S1GMR4_9PELO|nr:unnamed protein product [Caenorhabditis auriculariae]